MRLQETVKQNPYCEDKGSIGAYIRYLRYNVDNWYCKQSTELRPIVVEIIKNKEELNDTAQMFGKRQ